MAKRTLTKTAPKKNPASRPMKVKVTKNPFVTTSTDKSKGQQFAGNILSKTSPQNLRHTGATLLQKAQGKLSRGMKGYAK